MVANCALIDSYAILVDLFSFALFGGVQNVGRPLRFLSLIRIAFYCIVDSAARDSFLCKMLNNLGLFHLWNQNVDYFAKSRLI